MRYPELEQQILQHLQNPNYQPVKPRVIAKQLGIDSERKSEVRISIKRLAKQGLLVYGANHLVYAVATNTPTAPVVQTAVKPAKAVDRKVVTGTFRRTSHGYGFVRPSNTPASSGRDDDIYIPQDDTLDAASGDLVTVRLSKQRRSDRKLAGEILEVLERDTRRFVGVYAESAGVGYVQVDGNIFKQPISVGDPGAKNACDGDKVVIEMVRFPSQRLEGEAVIAEVLGARGQPGVDTLSIIHEFALPDAFPEDVLESARQQASLFHEDDLGTRRDFTADTVITIDPVDARDFDDAISLQRLDNGHWLLGVHIADVAHFVPEKSALDREARDRATSIYLPDRVIPMLPEIISNNLASLQPDRVRYTKTAIIEFSADGVPVHSEVHHGAIKSKRRFAYEEVDDFLANSAPWREKLTPDVFSLLERMHELAMLMRKRRLDRGSLELTLPEVKIDLDKQGKVSGAHVVVNTVSHQIIEEFMLAANEAVARILKEQEVDFLRRVHEPPDPRKLKALTDFVKELGIPCDSLESRFEIKRVIAEVEDCPEQYAVNYAVLRSMQKAHYSPEDAGHYALYSRNYCHFTSPIRRYPDLTVHRAFNALLAGRRPHDTFDQLTVLGEHCSEREQRAAEAERELIKVKLLGHLSERLGEQMDAVITGVESFGLFAMGTDLPAEGLIHISTLRDDFYRFDRRSHSLVGNKANNAFRLGDQVRVEIARVDVDGRELDLRIVKRLHRGSHLTKQRHEDQEFSQSSPGKRKAGKGKKKGKSVKKKRR